MVITINGNPMDVAPGMTVAAAILASGDTEFRSSLTGEPRGALCGMGICFECRVSIDGVPHQRSCTTPVRDGMEIVTGG
jgi:D-hydroxyproline dehydrogenase subunit gamma